MTTPQPADAWRTIDGCALLLKALGAPPRLIQHGRLVCEAADAILAAVKPLGVEVDAARVRAGAMLHDAGKARHPSELDRPGNLHEATGRAALLSVGIDDSVARFCETHADWMAEGLEIEDLLVALADKLWKGKRQQDLENRVIEHLVKLTGRDRWELMLELDDRFEKIAGAAQQRLDRSVPGGAS